MIYPTPKVCKSGWLFWTKYTLINDYNFKAKIFGHDIETAFVDLKSTGEMQFKAGYQFAASGPTIDTTTCITGALIHDGLYLLLKRGLPEHYRKTADNLLFDLLIDAGMIFLRAKRWWIGVRLFGRWAL